MRNFIKLTEIVFDGNGSNSKEYDDALKPELIGFIEPMSKNGKNVSRISFNIGNESKQIYVKQTPSELDELISDYYKNRRNK